MADLDFSSRIYRNITGQEETPTDWLFSPVNRTYSSLGWSWGYRQMHTRVLMEIPAAASGDAIINGYWTSGTYMKSKFEISTYFQTVTEFIPESLRVFLGGRLYDSSKVTTRANNYLLRADRFILSMVTPADNDYLWVSYIPAQSSRALGDQTSWFWSRGARADLQTPTVSPELIHQIRLVINNIEIYLGMEATIWCGGIGNIVKSSARNIIPGLTPIMAVHIHEMVSAVKRIEQYADDITPNITGRFAFSSVGHDGPFMIEYVEEILQALYSVELYIINEISGNDLN